MQCDDFKIYYSIHGIPECKCFEDSPVCVVLVYQVDWGQLYTWNQSIVQQLMSEGNILRRLRKASPIGLIASTMWRFCLTRSMKKLYIARGVASIFLPWKPIMANLKTEDLKNQKKRLHIVRSTVYMAHSLTLHVIPSILTNVSSIRKYGITDYLWTLPNRGLSTMFSPVHD